jgi:hypothetical protein
MKLLKLCLDPSHSIYLGYSESDGIFDYATNLLGDSF